MERIFLTIYFCVTERVLTRDNHKLHAKPVRPVLLDLHREFNGVWTFVNVFLDVSSKLRGDILLIL